MALIIERLQREGYDDKERAKATAYARGFTWQREADATLALYKRLIENA
jgi:hypothetical protein